MTFNPTEEQLACVQAATQSQDNLVINALAGCAKTSTLKLIMRALPAHSPILYLVFNKRNADEAKAEQEAGAIPSNVTVLTFNSCGHRAWMATLGKKKITLNADKLYSILKDYTDGLKGDEKREAYDCFKETLDLIRGAKRAGVLPEGKYPTVSRLICLEDFLSSLDFDPTEAQLAALQYTLFQSIQQAYSGIIDFDDQIYMPTLFGGTFSRFPLVMADEAQDLSPLNHAMLRKLVTKRVIIVGDPWQSIYGFRGAVANGMAELKSAFNMQSLSLSTSFRCPRQVIRRAQARVPQMNWPEWAPEGEVYDYATEKLEWRSSNISDGAAVLCRNNAPLFKLGLGLIKARRSVKIVGADIGPALVKVLKKLGEPSITQAEVFTGISSWEAAQLVKSKKKASIHDRAECLRVFASEADTLGTAIAFAEHLFTAGGTIQLLSGHKAKGLEWKTVFHLDPWRIPSEWGGDVEQELNIKYVIETRAKHSLWLVNLEDFRG